MKKCSFCGRFFRPDVRVGNRQKSCYQEACKKKRKKASQRNWIKANPEYFHGRYQEIRLWREKNPGYQREWRMKSREIQDKIPSLTSLATIRIVVPAKLLKGEIQDEFRLVRQCGCGFWLAGEGRKIQDTMAV